MEKDYQNKLKLVVLLILLVVVTGFTTITLQAQENSTLMAEVGYMKVASGHGADYVNMERNIWKPIHEERIKKGLLAGWILYRVWYTGTDDNYNYVTVNLYKDGAGMEDSYKGIKFEEIHPDKDMSKVMEKTLLLREMVRVQLINRVNYVYPNGGETVGQFKFIVLNFMKGVPNGNFFQVENDIAKPVAKVLVDEGAWAGWSVWSNVFPRGANMQHDFATVDYYSDFSKLGGANYRMAFEKAHPEKSWSEAVGKFNQARTTVRSELWEVVDLVLPEQ